MTVHSFHDALQTLANIQNLKSSDEVVDATLDNLRPFGVQGFAVSKPRNPNKRLEDVILAKRIRHDMTGVYAEWIKTYSDNRYADDDPLVRQMQRTWKPFGWHEVTYDREREPRAEEIMRRRMALGFGDGMVIPVYGRRGFLGFASMCGERMEVDARSKPTIHMMGLYAFHRVCCLTTANDPTRPQLTPREREVLTWVANGKSAWEIGEILKIAKRTVDEHAQTACQKLGAVNRAQAVAIAVRDVLIQF